VQSAETSVVEAVQATSDVSNYVGLLLCLMPSS